MDSEPNSIFFRIFLSGKQTNKNHYFTVLLINLCADEGTPNESVPTPELPSRRPEAELHHFTPFDNLLNAFSFRGRSVPHRICGAGLPELLFALK